MRGRIPTARPVRFRQGLRAAILQFCDLPATLDRDNLATAPTADGGLYEIRWHFHGDCPHNGEPIGPGSHLDDGLGALKRLEELIGHIKTNAGVTPDGHARIRGLFQVEYARLSGDRE